MNCHYFVAVDVPLSVQDCTGPIRTVGNSSCWQGIFCLIYMWHQARKKVCDCCTGHLEVEFYITLTCVHIENVCSNNKMSALLINILLKSKVYRGGCRSSYTEYM